MMRQHQRCLCKGGHDKLPSITAIPRCDDASWLLALKSSSKLGRISYSHIFWLLQIAQWGPRGDPARPNLGHDG